ncbi:MAG: hypothetical protein GXP26_15820 [Planctomycetes bacterium]|nr:hypothetical protein [Planctomycetota bacterium]
MTQTPEHQEHHPSFEGRIGVARSDITPPVGIYSRMWGCAQHDRAEGVHRNLMATALALEPTCDGEPLVLIQLDLGWWRLAEDELFVRSAVLETLGLDEARLVITLSHTHSGPSTSREQADRPGGEKIEPYLLQLREATIDVARRALASVAPARLTWTTGRCDLARNRDFLSPDGSGIACGYNPHVVADDTLLFGRVTDMQGTILATIVNYACHPTTLGGRNRLISPDYVGAMRETVETVTCDAPCLFLHGASAELAPREQYVADTDVADRNGRQLGYAALSALEGMLPAGTALRFEGVEDSGAPLASWRRVPHDVSTVLRVEQFAVDLPLKDELLPENLLSQLDTCSDRVELERLERMAALCRRFDHGRKAHIPVWLWQLGDAFLVFTPTEANSGFQTELRRKFTKFAVAVTNVANGYVGYVPPADTYDGGSYQSRISPFQPGCLERLTDACAAKVVQLMQIEQRPDKANSTEDVLPNKKETTDGHG